MFDLYPLVSGKILQFMLMMVCYVGINLMKLYVYDVKEILLSRIFTSFSDEWLIN